MNSFFIILYIYHLGPSRFTSNVPDLKEKDSNGHFSSLRSLYPSSSSRYVCIIKKFNISYKIN